MRVFVHITDDAQLPLADQLRADLGELRLRGEAVGMAPVRFVRRAPHRTQVRCLKHADCASARALAIYLQPELGPVAVIDMSASYERDQAVRPGSLELWLPPELETFR